MSTTKVLSTNNLKRIVGVSRNQPKKVQWHTSEIIIEQLLPLEKQIGLVQKIIKDCSSTTEDIAIELLDFSIRTNIISAYAHVELPSEIEDLFYIVYASDLFEKVCATANKGQIDAIRECVKYHIDRMYPIWQNTGGENG